MKSQRIKDVDGNVILLFATAAKIKVSDTYTPVYGIKRAELRAALMQDSSAFFNWYTDDSSSPADFYTQLYDSGLDSTRPGLMDNRQYGRVGVIWLKGKRIHQTRLTIGCKRFVGTNAEIFYRWAMSQTPLKRNVKHGK